MINVQHKNIKKGALPRTGRGLDIARGSMTIAGGSSGSGSGSGGGVVDVDIDIIHGDGIDVDKNATGKITYMISHAETSIAESITKVEKKAIAGVDIDSFGHVTGIETCDILALDDLDKRYIFKKQNDIGYGFYTWEAGFMTKSTIRSAEYNTGWEAETPTGWSVSKTGTAWYTSLNVRGPILSNNIIGSPYYASGWTGFGSQWDLVNHRLETDFISVRKELRVYAMDVFRIYGTNGDLAVSTTNKVDRVEDMGSVWRCYIDDYNGEMYMNMRVDDVVRCQTWEKLSGRYYMAQVTAIGETWFELSKTLLEGTTTPAKGDILIRWDNLSNPDRKGLLYLSASDSYAPYMDVRYGDWNAQQGTIKVRNGRLDGINDPAFPELYGAQNNFGLYTCNFYGTGELILRSTGESVSRTFEVLKDSIKMGLGDIRYEIQVSQDSILSNPIFKDNTTGWDITNVIYPWTINGSLLSSSSNPFVNFISGAIRVNDPVNDRTVLQVSDTTVTQRNAIFTARKPGKYALRFSYRSLLGFGKMEVGVPGSNLKISVPLSENQEYQKADIIGDWDGTGDFIIKVTGGVVNITDISFTSDKLANAIKEVEVKYDTKLTFYAEKAVMNSFREEYDKFNQVVKKDYATQTWTYNAINTEVGTIVNGKLTNYSTTEQTSRLIGNAVYDLNLSQYAKTEWTSEQITNSVSGKTSLKDVKTMLSQTATDYTISISAMPNNVKNAADATTTFFNFHINGLSMNKRLEVGTGTTAGNFTCQGGISANTYYDGNYNVMLWTGGSFHNAVNSTVGTLLRHDGSGYLAKKNIVWDTLGNTTFRGRVESNSSGNRAIIDPSSIDKFAMYNSSNYRSFRIFFDSYDGGEYNSLEFSSPGSTVRLGNAGLSISIGDCRMSVLKGIKGKLSLSGTWPSYEEAFYGDVYKDGNTLKVKQ